ncbi:hypothetical protein AVEN_54474-1 [Araneus ventricosus]|uniref:Uncharacterized protein n=1 Tax=Araneus ventricosus TaxID=182803 RepID=A0A4Y2TDN8_ARAVE|nr:hypothetical protein AVEN_54474-1 [Araneus ventricosus]
MHLAMELRTATGVPVCAFTRNVSREAHVPQSLLLSVWFQHDGIPPHYTNDVRQHLNVTFESIGLVVIVKFLGLLDRRTYHA